MKRKATFGGIAILLGALACNSAAPRVQDSTNPLQTPAVDRTIETVTETVSPPTPTPAASLGPENVDQLTYLHAYWPAVFAEAEPVAGEEWEMLPTWVALAITLSPDGRYVGIGGCTIGGFTGGESGRAWCGVRDDPSDDQDHRTLGFIVNAETEQVISRLPDYPADTTITDLDFTHDGEKLLIATDPGKVEVLNVVSGQVGSVVWQGVGYPLVTISPDDRWAALSDFQQVNIIDLATGDTLAQLSESYSLLAPAPYVSSDGTRLAILDTDGFRIFETATWTEVGATAFPCIDSCLAAFSHDLGLLAIWENGDEQVQIRATATGATLQTISIDQQELMGMEFTADDRMLMAATADGFFRFGRTDTGEALASYPMGAPPPVGFQGYFLKFSDDGRSFLAPSMVGIDLYGLP